MNLVYGYLCRFDVIIDDRLVLQKRLPGEVGGLTLHPRSLIYPWDERRAYFRGYRKAAAGSGYLAFTAAVLIARFAYDYWFNRRAQHDYEVWRLRWRGRLVVCLRWIGKGIRAVCARARAFSSRDWKT